MATIIGMKGINTMPIGYTVEEKVRPKGDTFKRENKMRRIKIIIMFGWVSMAVLQSTFAEYRIWKDKKGHSIEAEFVCERSGLVMIKKRDGKILKLPKGKLSDADQKYLASEISPKVELVFSKKQDRRNRSDSYAEVDMECEVTVKRKVRRCTTNRFRLSSW
jgi:hypothetical protein